MHITYLLGAGASAQKMPIVAKMRERILTIPKFLQEKSRGITLIKDGIDIACIDIATEINKYASFLNNKLANHFSIDTYARKLYLSGKEDDLNKLKTFISMFFTIEQLQKGNDPRYDAFFSSIIEKDETGLVFPDNISLVSWNYDLQVYNSIEDTCGYNKVSKSTTMIGELFADTVDPNFNKYIKLNGIAGVSFHERDNGIGFNEVYTRFNFEEIRANKEYVKILVQNLGQLWVDQVHNNAIKSPLIEFSWENSTMKERHLKIAEDHFAHSNVLVVIGYSFPTFNKRIDQSLLYKLPKRCKIFVQCDKATDDIVEKIELMLTPVTDATTSRKVIPIYQSSEFHIPQEFFIT